MQTDARILEISLGLNSYYSPQVVVVVVVVLFYVHGKHLRSCRFPSHGTNIFVCNTLLPVIGRRAVDVGDSQNLWSALLL